MTPDQLASGDVPPLVSVIVLNWNGRHLLPACLSALDRQTLTGFELIVVDNGSTDGSADWVAENYPTARLVRLDKNNGFCGGNNAGLRVARGQFIALLNNDIEVEAGWLAALAETLQADPQVGACDSRVYFLHRRDMLWAAGADYTISGSVNHRGYLERDPDVLAQTPTEVFVAIACSALYRRSALERVGFLDEDFFYGYEDVDLSFRLHLAGYRVVTVPNAVAFHRVSETTHINSSFYVFHGQRNVSFVFLKNMPGPLLIKYLPLHIAHTLGSLAHFARHGQLWPALRGKVAVLRQGRRLLEKRRAVQQLRSISLRQLEQCLSREWLLPKLGKLIKGV